MSLKQSFADQVKAQADIWNAQVKEYQDRAEQAGEKARGEYKKAVEQMEAKAEEARRLLKQVQGANETAWKDMNTATQKAFAELQKGWGDAVSRFK
jgi:hypothetical protein